MEVKTMSNTYHGEDGSIIMPSLITGDDPFISLLVCWSHGGRRYQKSVYIHFDGTVHHGDAHLQPNQEEAV